jgi:hypothetical protein
VSKCPQRISFVSALERDVTIMGKRDMDSDCCMTKY